MNTEVLQKICKQLPSVKEDIKWGHDLAFSVGGKMFCVIALEETPVSACFKVRDEEFEDMCHWPGVKPAPYVARYKWVLVEDISKMKTSDWKFYLKQSYDLVKSKLNKKVRANLD